MRQILVAFFFFSFLILLFSCTNNSTDVVVTKPAQSLVEPNIDKLSGCSKDGFLDVFLNQIKIPTDSAFYACVNEISVYRGDEVLNDFDLDELKINEAIAFLEFKFDKLEKYKSYEMDRSIKHKMLDYIRMQILLLDIDCRIMCKKDKGINKMSDDEFNEYFILFEVLYKKVNKNEALINQIIKEYEDLHNRT